MLLLPISFARGLRGPWSPKAGPNVFERITRVRSEFLQKSAGRESGCNAADFAGVTMSASLAAPGMDAPPIEPDDLPARARAGDEDAARTLVERLHPLVMKIVRSHLPRRAAEEDLAQEVYGRIFERLHQYEERAGVPFEHWVARLTVRTCLDALRSERRRPEWRWADLSEGETEWLATLADERSEAETTAGASAASARELLDRLLEPLSPDDRLVIRLLDLEEKSVAEVSRWTGWSAVGVRVRAFRARQRVRRVAEALRREIEP